MTTQKSTISSKQPDEQESYLETASRELMKEYSASGLTMGVMEQPIPTEKSKVTFVPRKRTKQTNQL